MPSIEKVLAIIGGAVIVLRLLKLLIDLSPKLQAIVSKSYDRLYDVFRIRRFRQLAISENIQTQVNAAVGIIHDELPPNWIRRVSVKWMRSTQPSYIKDNEIVLRMRPDENPDRTFLLTLHTYLDTCIFPDVKAIVPENVQGAVLLSLMKKVVSSKYSAIRELFDSEVFQPAIRSKPHVAGHYGDIESLEEIGFFTSIYLREIEKASVRVQLTHDRDNFENIIKDLASHLKKFRILSPELMPIQESDWRYISNYFSHAIILVAHPLKAKNDELDAYYNRVLRGLELGIATVYILGSAAEKTFVQAVITRAMDIKGYKLDRLFKLSNDYRRKKGGLCAIFLKDQYVSGKPPNQPIKQTEDAADPGEPQLVEVTGDGYMQQLQGSVVTLSTSEIVPRSSGAVGNGKPSTPVLPAVVQPQATKDELVKYITKYLQRARIWGSDVHIQQLGLALNKKFRGHLNYSAIGYTGLLALVKDIPELEAIPHGNSGSIKVVRRIITKAGAIADSAEPRRDTHELEELVLTIIETHKDESGHIFLGLLGDQLKRANPDFAPKIYGYATLTGLIKSLTAVKIEHREKGGTFHAYVGKK